MKKFSKILSLTLALLLCICLMAGCGEAKEKVVIFTSAEDFRIEDLRARLNETFPHYNIVIEYMSTGNHAAKLKTEGTNTECDITYDLEYPYLDELENAGVLAKLDGYDKSVFLPELSSSDYYLPEVRNGGAVIVDKAALDAKGIAVPSCYEDLLRPEYKGLICMPNPKSSGTGFMFLKSLSVAWGEEKALEYFDKLAENVVEFSSSGSGPINKLIQKETAIGLGMTSQAVNANNKGSELTILFFNEGSPYSMYGQAIIEGKQTRTAVKEVFDFMINTYESETNNKFYPEQVYASGAGKVENYPTDITYSDMGDNSPAAKEALLAKWKY